MEVFAEEIHEVVGLSLGSDLVVELDGLFHHHPQGHVSRVQPHRVSHARVPIALQITT